MKLTNLKNYKIKMISNCKNNKMIQNNFKKNLVFINKKKKNMNNNYNRQK